MLEQLKLAPLFGSVLNPPLNVAVVWTTMVRLSWLVHDLRDSLQELDINPVLVLADGAGMRRGGQARAVGLRPDAPRPYSVRIRRGKRWESATGRAAGVGRTRPPGGGDVGKAAVVRNWPSLGTIQRRDDLVAVITGAATMRSVPGRTSKELPGEVWRARPTSPCPPTSRSLPP